MACLAGMGDLRQVYRFLAPALVEAGYRVATMDLRGHGESDDGFSAYDNVAAGQDALALIDHLGGPALIVSNSMTAGASVLATVNDPAKVAGLVMLGAVVRDSNPGGLVALAQQLALVKPWGPAAWRAYYRSLYKTRPPEDLGEHLRRMTESMRRGDHWKSFVKTSRTSHAPAEARLAEVRTQVLIVMGDKDPDFPDPVAEARFIGDELGGEVLIVPGAGHYPMAEFPEIVSPAVVEFARRVHAGA